MKRRNSKQEQDVQRILRLERALEEVWESTRIGLGFLNADERLFRRSGPAERKSSSKIRERPLRK
jgi:hypothetical protein